MNPETGSWHSPWLRGYSYELCPLDGGWYWKLFRDGERVNGGIARSRLEAVHCAGLSAQQHQGTFREAPGKNPEPY